MLRFCECVFFRFGITLIFFLSVVGCSRAPKGIISEKKMQQVITDIYMADAIINSDPYTFGRDEDKKALYQSVFDKYRITEALYDTSLIWYGKNLDVYMQVNNMALAEVKRRIEKTGSIEPEKTSIVNEDSIDIWTERRYYEFFPTSLSNTVIFRFRSETDYPSGSVFILGLHVLGLVRDMQSPVEVHLRAEQNDTTIVATQTITTNGYHETILRTLPVQRVKQVYGYVRLNADTVPYHKIYLNDFRMIKYRYSMNSE